MYKYTLHVITEPIDQIEVQADHAGKVIECRISRVELLNLVDATCKSARVTLASVYFRHFCWENFPPKITISPPQTAARLCAIVNWLSFFSSFV